MRRCFYVYMFRCFKIHVNFSSMMTSDIRLTLIRAEL